MAYRKLGRDNKHRRSMLATLTKQVVENESITTTETRAKEVRKFVEKMITYGKKGDLVSRRKALAFLHNDTEVVEKIFNDLAKRYENRNGGYTQILKLAERRGDDALMVILKLVDEAKPEKEKKTAKKEKEELKEETPKTAEEPSFFERIGKAFSESWKAFGEFCMDFAVFTVAAIPTLIVLAVLGIVSLIIVRAIVKKKKAK